MPVFMFVSMSELQSQPWQRKGRNGWGGTGGGGGWEGRLNCADDSTSIFPDKYWTVVRLSASRRICPDAAPRISGLGRDGAVRHVGWLWRRSDARVPSLPRARITKSCQARRAWTQHDSAPDTKNPRSRRNSSHSFLKTIWLLSANRGKSRHLFECWINISEPWGVISKCGIVVGSCFHLCDWSAILLP